MRYRGAALAEFMRALRTLKALQAEQAAVELAHGSFRSHQPACPPDRPKATIDERMGGGAGRGYAQAEHGLAVAAAMPIQTQPGGSAGCPIADRRLGPNEPGHAAALRLEYVPPAPVEPGRALHEPAAAWIPSEPEAEHPARPNAPQASEHGDVAQPQ
jgi:hypothetical protein